MLSATRLNDGSRNDHEVFLANGFLILPDVFVEPTFPSGSAVVSLQNRAMTVK